MFLQVFPVTGSLSDLILSIRLDLVQWGVVIIGVSLFLYGFHRIVTVIAEREGQRAYDEYKATTRWEDRIR